jgi:hypothetical protein
MRRGDSGGSISSGLLERQFEPQTTASQAGQSESSVCLADTLQTVELDWDTAWVDLGGEG